jgi:hypothetical protein
MVIHNESQREKNTSFQHSRWHRWITDSPEQYCIVGPQILNDRFGKQFAGGVVSARPKVIVSGDKLTTSTWSNRLKNLDGLSDNFGANAVTWD